MLGMKNQVKLSHITTVCFALLVFVFAANVQAAEEGGESPSSTPAVAASSEAENPFPRVALGVLGGFNINPEGFAIATHADFELASFFSLGPLVQWGFYDTRTFLLVTGGGKFHVRLPDQMLDELAFTFQSGVGYFYRRVGGLGFDRFVLIAGPGLEYNFMPHWVAEAFFLFDVSDDPIDDLFFSCLFGVKYQF